VPHRVAHRPSHLLNRPPAAFAVVTLLLVMLTGCASSDRPDSRAGLAQLPASSSPRAEASASTAVASRAALVSAQAAASRAAQAARSAAASRSAQAAAPSCEPGYSPCIPLGVGDIDCAGGSGNGPRYVQGPIQVTGSDPYGLDRDHDGIGCE